MSVISYFRMSSDSEIEYLLNHPELLYDQLESESDEDIDDVEIDLDKAWHGIHYLLCGQEKKGKFPLGFIMNGGSTVGNVDLDDDIARVFVSSEVVQIAQAIEPITSDQLRSRFDPEIFSDKKIYPDIWDEPIEECLDEYLLDYFDTLKKFIIKVKEKGKGLIVYLEN